MGGAEGLDAFLAHSVGQLAETFGGVDRDGFAGDAGPQGLGIGEEFAEDVEVGRFGEPGEIELVHLLGGAGEIGVNLEAVHVADDEEGRVFEILAVPEQLGVGFFEVFALAFVLPAEMAAHPDVGPAVAAFDFLDAAFEGVPRAVGIGVGRFGLSEEIAEIKEVLLTDAPLGEMHLLPLGDELLGSHASRGMWCDGGLLISDATLWGCGATTGLWAGCNPIVDNSAMVLHTFRNTWIPREAETTLARIAGERPAMIVTGTRQAGKTSLLRRVFPAYDHVSLSWTPAWRRSWPVFGP